ncbi:AraC family transcriptional regulator [Proteus mirabilis]|nr:AraC family transcriptional regulator [Proteus mirabilis]
MQNFDHFFEQIETTIGVDYMLRAREGVPTKGVYIRPHVHLEHEIMWFRYAQGAYTIGNEKFKIKNNTLVLVCPMVLHDMKLIFTEDHERFLLQFDNAVLNRLKYQLPHPYLHSGFILQLNEQDAERIQFLFDWFTEMHDSQDHEEDINPLLTLLLSTVFNHAKNAENITVKQNQNSTFENIINFVIDVEKKSQFNISLEEASSYCGFSPSHFSRSFKKIMQISFKEYLTRKKIAQSTELLRNTDLSITEIAYQCEFTDSAYYCFKFRSLMGVTPNKFRNHSRTTKQLSTKHDFPEIN